MDHSVDVLRRNLTLKQSQVRAKNNEQEWISRDIEEKTRKADILGSSIDVLKTKLRVAQHKSEGLREEILSKKTALVSVVKTDTTETDNAQKE